MAIVTGSTRYEEREDGKTTVAENWLSLTFSKESSGWRLVHDQNTRMNAKP
jgi:ketosteroid isomerase-like protein